MSPNRSVAVGLLTAILALPAAAQEPPIAAKDATAHVVRLEYAVADDVAQTLRQLIGSERGGAVIVGHAGSNSLLITASDARLRQIKDLVAELDVRVEQDPNQATIAVDGDLVTLVFGEEQRLTVMELTKMAQLLTGRVYTIEARLGARQIQLVGTLKVQRSEFAGLFQTLLWTEGLCIARREEDGTEIFEIVPTEQDDATGTSLVAVERPDAGGANEVRTIIDLAHLEARQTVADLSHFVDAETRVGVIGTGGSVLIQGPESSVRRVAQLLKHVDAAARVATTTNVIWLEHSDAGRMAGTLSQLLGPVGPVQQMPWTNSSFRAVAAGPKALVLTGPEAVVKAALGVIAQLDVER